ncbi:type VI secretion system Vgr family protein [Duganella violaceipulchra]|uniref:Type VI secretion system secreted protein VgrG n=1 Tax=Duganella violaceipulchra TaxID=2849652 RepID=A0AA41HAC0_9BURK|nr:type VI secretion system tip protein TssI/VgrG [Duganella violaceicalia]MBV6324937.1 type VI secretion system tip protein VgrG [Duganella violaceicalia]MCP2012314.1 type VI secretion system secreted protein VgrG [Duganella violaceicalia]
MRTGFEQPGGLLTVSSPFGDNDLLLDAVEGSEGISELFKFNLHMRSGSTNLSAATVVGKSMTVTLDVTGGTTRYITGMVSRFIQSGFDQDFATYEAEVVPMLWLLTLSRDRKIYQAKSVADIVKAVLGDFSITFDDKLTQTYDPVDYIVQYDETAFDFICRLMEQAGIFYFFTFSSSAHTMVLGDASSNFTDCAGAAAVRFFPRTGMNNPIDTVSRFAHENTIAVKKATVNDYDFINPSTSLEGTHSAAGGSGAVYEFATGHLAAAAATAIAQLRVEASQVNAEVLRGDSFCYPFSAGTKFTLSEHFVTALNAAFVLRRVHHTARDDMYTNSFEAFPVTVPFRPPVQTARPRAVGCETALVVGPSGEEIWTDKYGRIKVQFPWDRDGAKDDKSSTWMRVAQSVAGKGFGALFLPRVGQEVVITYLNGDPERPLVTGCVYNGENATPAELPANQTQTIMRTWSSKQGAAGNELRFEDKKDSEQLYLHAQKDMLTEIENALTTTVKKGAEIHTLQEGDRTVDVQKGKEVHNVKATREVAVTGDETHTNAAKFTHKVTGDYALTIDGKLTITVTGDISIKSSAAVTEESGTTYGITAGTALTAKAGTALTNESGTDFTNKAGTKMVNQAAVQMDNKAPVINSKADATQTVEAGAMLTLKGAMAKVN